MKRLILRKIGGLEMSGVYFERLQNRRKSRKFVIFGGGDSVRGRGGSGCTRMGAGCDQWQKLGIYIYIYIQDGALVEVVPE